MPATPDESTLVFNIVFTPASFRYLKLFTLSLLEHSRARFRLVANGCAPTELREMGELAAERRDRLTDVVRLSSEVTISHAEALDELYREQVDGDWFCFIDSDIKANGPLIADSLHWLSRCAALTSGDVAWTGDRVLPEGVSGVVGRHVFDKDGFVYGSSYLAIYRRSSVNLVRRRWGLGFAGGPHASLPVHTQRRLEEFGRAFKMYDTAKPLNILLQAEGLQVRHVEHPQLVHIGGLSEYWCETTDVQRPSAWASLPRDSSGRPAWASQEGHGRDRWDLSRFAALTLECLVRGEEPPPLPPDARSGLYAPMEAVRAELVDLVARYS